MLCREALRAHLVTHDGFPDWINDTSVPKRQVNSTFSDIVALFTSPTSVSAPRINLIRCLFSEDLSSVNRGSLLAKPERNDNSPKYL